MELNEIPVDTLYMPVARETGSYALTVVREVRSSTPTG